MSDRPAPDAASAPEGVAAPKRQLTLFDSTSIIVGIIIGAGIYRTTPFIAGSLPSAGWLMGVWVLGGVLSLIGALCYAELATAYPEEGGDYVYLTRAFGRGVGFLFAWAQLWVVRPGSIGAMAYVFAEYANNIWPQAGGPHKVWALMAYAVAPVAVLSIVNILGVREGKWTQNALTTVKILGLAAIFAVGLALALTGNAAAPPPAARSWFGGGLPSLDQFGTAMILVLFTYGGWNEMAYVGAEVRDPDRNILRALLLGTVAVAITYVLVTLAFLAAVGFEGVRSPTVAADVLERGLDAARPGWGGMASRLLSLLICISALGAINGQIFTGSRIYYAMGTDHRLYSPLGRWHPRLGTPVVSLVVQAVITVGLVAWFGRTENGFEKMVMFTTPAFWFFLVLVGLSVFVLRHREPLAPRPYRVPGYPATPVLFCLSSAFVVYSSLNYAISKREEGWEVWWAVGILAVGVLMSFLNFRREPRPATDRPS